MARAIFRGVYVVPRGGFADDGDLSYLPTESIHHHAKVLGLAHQDRSSTSVFASRDRGDKRQRFGTTSGIAFSFTRIGISGAAGS